MKRRQKWRENFGQLLLPKRRTKGGQVSVTLCGHLVTKVEKIFVFEIDSLSDRARRADSDALVLFSLR